MGSTVSRIKVLRQDEVRGLSTACLKNSERFDRLHLSLNQQGDKAPKRALGSDSPVSP